VSAVIRPDVVHSWVSFASVAAACGPSWDARSFSASQQHRGRDRWNFDGLSSHWRELRAAFALADA
jgi:hypothetical protein